MLSKKASKSSDLEAAITWQRSDQSDPEWRSRTAILGAILKRVT
jgi:hypothetical protein